MSKNITNCKTLNEPKPFLKWAGGKSQLLAQLEELLPENFNNYIEPMVGGGAVFFHLYNSKRIAGAILVDINRELISCYEVIKNDVENLIAMLKNLKKKYESKPKETYYGIRKWDRRKDYKDRTKVEKVARTIFLNKTCYNGLYRVNKKGQFNTPMGKYKNPRICDEDNLRKVNSALRKVNLVCDDFEKTVQLAKPGDFIYFDPPYYPISETAYFTSYSKEDFGKEEQIRLKEVFSNLSDKSCKVMLSNSDTSFIKKLYSDFNIHKVHAKRHINSNSDGRGKISEIVVTNY